MAAVVLAAGSSTRMGKPKQVLPLGNGTLVGRAVDVAIAAGFRPVIVVVGANAEAVRSEICSKPIEIVFNTHWQLGMGSSIHAGVKLLRETDQNVAAVALLAGDQPLVRSEQLEAMRQRAIDTGADIVAAEYSGTVGIPTIFRRTLLGRLMDLPPGAGAKVLIQAADLKVERFPLPEAAEDVDTPEDLLRLS